MELLKKPICLPLNLHQEHLAELQTETKAPLSPNLLDHEVILPDPPTHTTSPLAIPCTTGESCYSQAPAQPHVMAPSP